ncbi:MAG: NIL domain-containing protein [Desulfovibrio sp.]|uniref:NIL domain-containing protein n=1 Tax=Desulfovibrio sp. 7SRBS1 TaxID=3378064 RepID=UPI003B402E50
MSEVAKSFKKMVYLSFPYDVSKHPVVCDLTRKFDLVFNILKAHITPRQEGFMTLEITGTEDNYLKGVEYLKSRGISVTPVSQKVARTEDACIHCGVCTTICPTNSLRVDPATQRVEFDMDTCSGCGMCVKVCPVKAMEIDLENGIL